MGGEAEHGVKVYSKKFWGFVESDNLVLMKTWGLRFASLVSGVKRVTVLSLGKLRGLARPRKSTSWLMYLLMALHMAARSWPDV